MSKQSSVQVIVRAWGNEPVILRAVRVDLQNDLIQLFKKDPKHSINLPMDDVFLYDECWYRELQLAFIEHKSADLARMFDLKNVGKNNCNKYQDMIRSLHEEETEVTDSECIEAGDGK